MPPDPVLDDRLPVTLLATLERPGGPWHALRVALDSAEAAGRQTILARIGPGRPDRLPGRVAGHRLAGGRGGTASDRRAAGREGAGRG